MKKPTVTLCMIVKDESHIIEQCLTSMAKYVDRYDITDTGSTDGTQDLIKKTMDELGVPGEVHQSDWKGFGDHAGRIGSRTESLQNAEASGADYAWVIDADDYIEGDFQYPDTMTADCYSLRIGRSDFTWWRNQIFKLSQKWRYVGILHEYADCEKPREEIINEKLDKSKYRIIARTEGNRNVGIDPTEKYKRDAKILEGALEEEPNNERYWFYLAQSYFDSQQWEKSLDAYSKRVELGGWAEEVYYAMLRCAIIKGVLEKPYEEVQNEFLKVFNFRPIRAEPLWFLSRMARSNNLPAVAYMYARLAYEIPYPEHDILFVQDDVYRWGILDEIGATAFYAGKPETGYQACKKLIEENLVPREHAERVASNYQSYINVINEMKSQEQGQRPLAYEPSKDEVSKNKVKKSTKAPKKTGYKKRTKQKA